GGYAGEDENGYTFLFGVPESESVVRIRCNVGLCSERQEAVALARRAAAKASDASNFIDPEAEQPSPFVPRGHVKGRAERIWLPLSRFWLPLRGEPCSRPAETSRPRWPDGAGAKEHSVEIEAWLQPSEGVDAGASRRPPGNRGFPGRVPPILVTFCL